MSVAELLYAAVGVVGFWVTLSDTNGQASSICYYLGPFVKHTTLAVYFWCFVFAQTTYGFFVGVFNKQNEIRDKLWKIALLCWTVPLLFDFIPYFFSGYGTAFHTCGIQNGGSESTFLILELICFYLPIGFATFGSFFYYLKIFRSTESMDVFEKKIILEMILYPLPAFTDFIISLVVGIITFFDGNISPYLLLFQIFFK